jgi:hypothetical protein
MDCYVVLDSFPTSTQMVMRLEGQDSFAFGMQIAITTLGVATANVGLFGVAGVDGHHGLCGGAAGPVDPVGPR